MPNATLASSAPPRAADPLAERIAQLAATTDFVATLIQLGRAAETDGQRAHLRFQRDARGRITGNAIELVASRNPREARQLTVRVDCRCGREIEVTVEVHPRPMSVLSPVFCATEEARCTCGAVYPIDVLNDSAEVAHAVREAEEV